MANLKVNVVLGEKLTKVQSRIKHKIISRDILCLQDIKLTLEQAMKPHRGCRGIALLFLQDTTLKYILALQK
jgi:exonuclease III